MVNRLISFMQNQDIRKAFGIRLKELRKQKGWTQKVLANRLNVQVSHLNKYESGMHIPPIEKLIQIADFFDVSLDCLVTGNPIEESPIRNTVLFKRFKALEHFNQDDQQTVIKVIDAIIAKQRMESVLEPL